MKEWDGIDQLVDSLVKLIGRLSGGGFCFVHEASSFPLVNHGYHRISMYKNHIES